MHAANSAAVLRDPEAQFDMVRCGIAVYGMDPFGEDPSARDLEPALELSSYVAEVKLCRAGESAGYGRRFIAEHDTHLGVLPIGYGDGWRRGLSNNAEVLIGGRRYPLVGTVSMDNITVDLGADPGAQRLRGEQAILMGVQGSERITAEEVARRLDTINYEVTCALTPRVPRVYHRDGAVIEGESGKDEHLMGARDEEMSDGLKAARTALAGERAWLVGGAIRDRALGRGTLDVDVVVDGDPAAAARAVARAAGRAACFALSEDFGAWRVMPRDSAWQLDVEPLRGGSLEADLASRDFTVNAIAEPIEGGAPIDPLGGLADLSARRLRMAGPGAFDEDPLRVLRLVRLAVELRLEPETRDVALRRRARRRTARRIRRARVRRAAPDHRRAAGAVGARDDERAGRHSGGAAGARGAARGRAEPLSPPRRVRPHLGGLRTHDRADRVRRQWGTGPECAARPRRGVRCWASTERRWTPCWPSRSPIS